MVQVVGKAVYERVLIAPQFANFFLRILLGKMNYVDDMESYSPQEHKNLLFLKKYEGSFDDLALTFAIDRVVLGVCLWWWCCD